MVMFGGTSATGQPLADTWLWDGSGWAQASPATSPPTQQDHPLALGVPGHLSSVPGGRAGRRRRLRPAGSIPQPGVGERLAGGARAPEHHHVAGGGVIGHGRARPGGRPTGGVPQGRVVAEPEVAGSHRSDHRHRYHQGTRPAAQTATVSPEYLHTSATRGPPMRFPRFRPLRRGQASSLCPAPATRPPDLSAATGRPAGPDRLAQKWPRARVSPPTRSGSAPRS